MTRHAALGVTSPSVETCHLPPLSSSTMSVPVPDSAASVRAAPAARSQLLYDPVAVLVRTVKLRLRGRVMAASVRCRVRP